MPSRPSILYVEDDDAIAEMYTNRILGWLTKSKSPPPIVARTVRRWLAVKALEG